MFPRRSAPIGIVLLALSSTVFAAPYDGKPKILLHVAPVTTKDACSLIMTDCGSANVTGSGGACFVYLLVARGSFLTVRDIECGITYGQDQPEAINNGAGIDMFSWVCCAPLQFPTSGWTNGGAEPLSANNIVWDPVCATGATAVAGYFYVGVYSADTLWVTRDPYNQTARLGTCFNDGAFLAGSDLGNVVFSPNADAPGCNPCNGPCQDRVVVPPPPPPPLPEPQPKIILHVTSVSTEHVCRPDQFQTCGAAVTSGGLSAHGVGPWHFVYLVASLVPPPVPHQTADIAGLECGITYDSNNPAGDLNGHGIDIFDWHLCATLQYPSSDPAWPKPGSGNLITWDPDNACQREGRPAIAGYFYMGAYDPDVLRIIPRPVDGRAVVAKCSGFELVAGESDLGFAAFSQGASVQGCNPCVTSCASAVPVRAVTWSGVKTLFR